MGVEKPLGSLLVWSQSQVVLLLKKSSFNIKLKKHLNDIA